MIVCTHGPRIGLAAVICVLGLVTGTAMAETVLIANASVTLDEVEAGMVQKIYLGRLTEWNKEAPIVPVLLAGGPVTNDFLKTLVKKTSFQFNAYWKRAVFTGTGTPPRTFDSEDELVAFIAKTEGAIGYVGSADDLPDEGIKILTIQQK